MKLSIRVRRRQGLDWQEIAAVNFDSHGSLEQFYVNHYSANTLIAHYGPHQTLKTTGDDLHSPANGKIGPR